MYRSDVKKAGGGSFIMEVSPRANYISSTLSTSLSIRNFKKVNALRLVKSGLADVFQLLLWRSTFGFCFNIIIRKA